MITCKEDLRGCYVPRCDKEAFNLFMDKCEEFDIKWAGNPDKPRDCILGEAVVFSGAERDQLTHGCSVYLSQKGYKRLTLSDLKPEENMKTYKTYQECKIANPECEIYTNGSALFTAEVGTPLDTKCNPSDHRMTVKELLDAGYRFEVGDLYISYEGRVCEAGEFGHSVGACNSPGCVAFSDDSYILRAAALKDRSHPEIHQDSEYYKNPRTKVEYVKVEDSIWHLESNFRAGHLFAFDGQDNYVQIETEGDFTLSHSVDNIHRRIETPMTEREAFIEAATYAYEKTKADDFPEFIEEMFDSGKFKLAN